MPQGHLRDCETPSLTSPLCPSRSQGHPSPRRPGGRAGSADRQAARRAGSSGGMGSGAVPALLLGVGKEKERGSHGNSESPHPPSLSHSQAHHSAPGDITGPGCAQAGPPEGGDDRAARDLLPTRGSMEVPPAPYGVLPLRPSPSALLAGKSAGLSLPSAAPPALWASQPWHQDLLLGPGSPDHPPPQPLPGPAPSSCRQLSETLQRAAAFAPRRAVGLPLSLSRVFARNLGTRQKQTGPGYS